jgi:carbamate kinase
MKDKPIVLVAFGGNALIQKGQEGTATEQFVNLQKPMSQLARLSEKYKIVSFAAARKL